MIQNCCKLEFMNLFTEKKKQKVSKILTKFSMASLRL